MPVMAYSGVGSLEVQAIIWIPCLICYLLGGEKSDWTLRYVEDVLDPDYYDVTGVIS